MPGHKAQIISNWFLEYNNELAVLRWPPPPPPDLSPREHLWDMEELEFQIMDVQRTDLQHLCDAIISIWNKKPVPNEVDGEFL